MKVIKKFVHLQELEVDDKFFIEKKDRLRKYRLKKFYYEFDSALIENVLTQTKKFVSLDKKVCILEEAHEKNARKNNILNLFSAIFLGSSS